MGPDLLAAAEWSCRAVPPGAATTPKELEATGWLETSWVAARVPGTAAGALRAASEANWSTRDYDAEDWWFRATFGAAETSGPFVLKIGGVATVADLWVNGEHCWHGTNMFCSDRVELSQLDPENELWVRCHALGPLLSERRGRPRWRTGLVAAQNLRFLRTTLLGRMPGWSSIAAPVGPWRPLTLHRVDPSVPDLVDAHLRSTVCGMRGRVEVRATLAASRPITDATATVAGQRRTLDVIAGPHGRFQLEGVVDLSEVERWWPHTHGDQPRYPVTLEVDGSDHSLGSVGFRTVELDRADGGFTLVVNETPIFCRGACWVPPDPVSLQAGPDQLRSTLVAAVEANMNLLRVPGTMVYESPEWFDLCDELGLLVWQDCMLANLDPPEEAAFAAELDAELDQCLGRLGRHPSLALVCGGSEVLQQAAMSGVRRERWSSGLLEQHIAAAVAVDLPDVPYVASTPSGGDLPFQLDQGVGHYFGVGAYLRSFDDVRRSAVRFAAECLAFSIPPEPATLEEEFGGPTVAGHHPRWKVGVPRDAGTSWDFEDVTHAYVQRLFAVDPVRCRYEDPARALDLERAAVAECMQAVFSEWRRGGSSCAGGLVLSLRDLYPGAGWGLLDAAGRPKAPWYVLRRLFAPLALLATDEGLNGLRLHAVNDRADAWTGNLEVALFAGGETLIESASTPLTVDGRDSVSLDAGSLFDGFRDLTYAYRFGPPAWDVITATLREPDGEPVSQILHLPCGLERPVEPDVGLVATVSGPGSSGGWSLECRSRRFAQWVQIDVPGFAPSDSWFHLAPGEARRIELRPVPATDSGRPPRGQLRALNSRTGGRMVVEGDG